MHQSLSATSIFAKPYPVYASLEQAFRQQPSASVSRIQEIHEEQTIVLFLIKGIQEGPTVWVQAALHGDEHDGIIACAKLLKDIVPEHLSGNLILCPVTNPTAMFAGTNGSPLDGINLNRVFGQNATDDSYSGRYGRWLANNIIAYADFLIDLHGGGRWLDVCPFAMVAADHEAAFERSMAALNKIPLTATYVCQSGTKGMLINEVCQQGIPAVLLESGGGNYWTSTAVDTHLQAVQMILDQLGVYSSEQFSQAEETPGMNRKPAQISDIVEMRFETSGLLTFSRQVGENARLGEELMRVLSYPGLEEQSIICPIEHGVILSIHAASTVHQNGYAVMLGKLA
ncbi:succinylglutamate desuccinylase/aspartoacylase family protein [Paenibacillus sp. ACRSA]|uniref:succinylglutamate desuccinylase/aspartoacylase domain-containing protein n=1 Tax=Paenibacillus sp. ACRSA TaxID=2918211 RepID=UPI001EF51A25|nr:succinylglutamate desuccinylase/aspartoacylase family protein [Paenibacillus sp. ACRSA]MCG7378618.1 succinylglutamate desuccinylase/aspartoacylase family protein [Paenibacillus sp. ACRSA]